jgi:Protein of unknown function (DUF2905)
MNLGRTLIVAGLVIAVLGVLVMVFSKLNLPLGRLPGDIVWRRGRTSVYFPWVTCLLLSAAATLLLWLLNRRP